MPREYRHVQEYEKEIIELREQGLTYREIGERLGFEQKKIKQFFERYHVKQRKLAAGMIIHRKGRPPKHEKISEEEKLAELRYILARKEARIKTLEMENKLMRDFLSQTGKE
mgnify:CR=1 FL=1